MIDDLKNSPMGEPIDEGKKWSGWKEPFLKLQKLTSFRVINI